jgi:hypothetical protein
MHNNNYPNYSHKYLNAEIKIKHKQIIINKRVWVKVTDVSMKMDTCRRVRVDDSTVCSETEHCSSGAGGELSYVRLDLDVAGAH